jgi:hypothetical protein
LGEACDPCDSGEETKEKERGYPSDGDRGLGNIIVWVWSELRVIAWLEVRFLKVGGEGRGLGEERRCERGRWRGRGRC